MDCVPQLHESIDGAIEEILDRLRPRTSASPTAPVTGSCASLPSPAPAFSATPERDLPAATHPQPSHADVIAAVKLQVRKLQCGLPEAFGRLKAAADADGAGGQAAAALKAAIIEVALELAQAIVRDGEGATKFISVVAERALRCIARRAVCSLERWS